MGPGGAEDAHVPADTVLQQDSRLPADVLRFRNYQPRDDELRALTVPAPDIVGMGRAAQAGGVGDTDGAAAEHAATEDSTVPEVVKMAPKKPDWDLKRDLAPKLAVLDRRTQRAIVKLLQAKADAATDAATS